MTERLTFVLVPGAGGSAWFWHPVVAELERRGHAAVAVDLPAQDETAGAQAFLQTIVAAAGSHQRLVMVGHSLGGFSVVPEALASESRKHAMEPTDRFFGDPCRFESWPDVPTSVIASEGDRLFPLDFQRRVAKERLGLDAIVVPGGHLAALARPLELTEALISCCA